MKVCSRNEDEEYKNTRRERAMKRNKKLTMSPSHCLYTSKNWWKQCQAPLWFHPDQQRPRRNPYHGAPYPTVTGSLHTHRQSGESAITNREMLQEICARK